MHSVSKVCNWCERNHIRKRKPVGISVNWKLVSSTLPLDAAEKSLPTQVYGLGIFVHIVHTVIIADVESSDALFFMVAAAADYKAHTTNNSVITFK
jgi:hypothetical protein